MRAAGLIGSMPLKTNIGRNLVVAHSILFLLALMPSVMCVTAAKADGLGITSIIFFATITFLGVLATMEFVISPTGWLTIRYFSERGKAASTS